MNSIPLNGWSFAIFKDVKKSPFERFFNIFKELILHTSGDFDEAIDWLRQLDKEYSLSEEDYNVDDFIDELMQKGYITKQFDLIGNKIKILDKFNTHQTI